MMSPTEYSIEKNPYTFKVLDASTGHITKKDYRILDSLCNFDDSPVMITKHDYGFYIHVPEDNMQATLTGCKHRDLSEHVANLITKAHQSGCKLLCLDRDGVEYHDLPTFSW